MRPQVARFILFTQFCVAVVAVLLLLAVLSGVK